MSKTLLLLAAKFLDEYADRLGCDCCNDWDWPPGLTDEEKALLQGEEYRKDFRNSGPPNWLACRNLADMLEKLAAKVIQ